MKGTHHDHALVQIQAPTPGPVLLGLVLDPGLIPIPAQPLILEVSP